MLNNMLWFSEWVIQRCSGVQAWGFLSPPRVNLLCIGLNTFPTLLPVVKSVTKSFTTKPGALPK